MRYIYFIKCGRRVKIGIAKDVRIRLSDIQTGNPQTVSLLGVIPNSTEADEMRLHHKFAEHRTGRGEWFHLSREIKAFITEKGEPLPAYKRKLKPAPKHYVQLNLDVEPSLRQMLASQAARLGIGQAALARQILAAGLSHA